jgi:hypothetical protein
MALVFFCRDVKALIKKEACLPCSEFVRQEATKERIKIRNCCNQQQTRTNQV